MGRVQKFIQRDVSIHSNTQNTNGVENENGDVQPKKNLWNQCEVGNWNEENGDHCPTKNSQEGSVQNDLIHRFERLQELQIIQFADSWHHSIGPSEKDACHDSGEQDGGG
tara:strand:+ start:286 stop:615 length:330 start_codon:yes stop_codon:yes gene_type:complete